MVLRRWRKRRGRKKKSKRLRRRNTKERTATHTRIIQQTDYKNLPTNTIIKDI